MMTTTMRMAARMNTITSTATNTTTRWSLSDTVIRPVRALPE